MLFLLQTFVPPTKHTFRIFVVCSDLARTVFPGRRMRACVRLTGTEHNASEVRGGEEERGSHARTDLHHRWQFTWSVVSYCVIGRWQKKGFIFRIPTMVFCAVWK